MRIAIVDDNKEFSAQVEILVRNFFAEREETAIIRIFCCGEELCSAQDAFMEYDLFLLDVEMPGMDGLKLTERLKEKNNNARVVYVTSYEKYAFRSIKLGAFYYILKSDLQSELPKLLERICQEDRENGREYIIQDGGKWTRFKVNDIRYLKKDGKYTVFHCKDRVELERCSLEVAYGRLPKDRFVFAGRGLIINAEHIVNISGHEVEMTDGATFVMSRFYYPEAMEVLTSYWGTK